MAGVEWVGWRRVGRVEGSKQLQPVGLYCAGLGLLSSAELEWETESLQIHSLSSFPTSRSWSGSSLCIHHSLCPGDFPPLLLPVSSLYHYAHSVTRPLTTWPPPQPIASPHTWCLAPAFQH